MARLTYFSQYDRFMSADLVKVGDTGKQTDLN